MGLRRGEGGGNQGKLEEEAERGEQKQREGVRSLLFFFFPELYSVMLPSIFPPDC